MGVETPFSLEESLLSREASKVGVSLRIARKAIRTVLSLPKEERDFLLGTQHLQLLSLHLEKEKEG